MSIPSALLGAALTVPSGSGILETAPKGPAAAMAADLAPRRGPGATAAGLAEQGLPAQPLEQQEALLLGAPLERRALIDTVLAQNPTLESARQAFLTLEQAVPQAGALPDPVLGYAFGPLSIASPDVRFGQVVDLSQRIPFPGKLRLAEEAALARVRAGAETVDVARLDLAATASKLYDALYLVDRAQDIFREHVALLRELEASARARYSAGAAPQEALLSAKIELAHSEHRLVVYEGDRAVLVAQLNALLHRAPSATLPAPPERLALPRPPPGAPEPAIAARPEARRAEAEVDAAAAALELAHRAFWPDLGLRAQYNSMWRELEHQLMVGLTVELPVQLGRRRAGVREAEAALARARSERARVDTDIAASVAAAEARFEESRRVVAIYDERLLETARARVFAARAEFESGRGRFLEVITAERELRAIELQYHESLAQLSQRTADLLRARGLVPGEGGER